MKLRSTAIGRLLVLACLTCFSVDEDDAVKKASATPPPKSAAVPRKAEVALEVGMRPKARDFVAGGPVELEWTIANGTSREVHYLAGSVHGRAAYLRFTAERPASGPALCDPAPDASLQADGMLARLPLAPGQVVARTIVLNQFLTLEDVRDALADGQRAKVAVRWQYVPDVRPTDDPTLATNPAEGTFEVTLVRNDDRLRETIAALQAQWAGDPKNASADLAGKRDAAIALTSLRVPEVVPTLRRLAEAANFEIRSMAEHALREIDHEPARRTRCD